MAEIGSGVELDDTPAWPTPAGTMPPGQTLSDTVPTVDPGTPVPGAQSPVYGPQWAPPTATDGGGGDRGDDSRGSASGDGPRHGPRTRAAAILAIVAMAVVSGGLGVAVGAALGRHSSTSTASVALPQAAPSSVPSSSGETLPSPGTAAPAARSTGGTLDAAAIAAKVDPGVVDINTTLANGQAAGTGIVLTSSGLVLTNNHVIEGSTSIEVQVDGSGPTYTAKVLGYDVSDDVALLQLQNASGLKTVAVGDSSKVAINDPVVAIGNALGRSGPPSVTQGRVAALDQSITANDTTGRAETLSNMIQISAPLQPGDSGGPLVNSAGQVIGMNTAANGGYRRYSASTVAFAIPINKALSIARQIQAGQESATVHVGARAILGVEVQDNSAFGSSTTGGAAVAGVAAGSPAESVGLSAGDVIVSVGGRAIASVSDLEPSLDRYHPGDKVSISWTDTSGQHHSATVQLASGPPA